MKNKKEMMTREGYEERQKELRNLIDVRRPEIIKQIQEAREQGDLSENADYDAAKNAQAQIEGRIKELQDLLSNVEIVDAKGKGNFVEFGATVRFKDYQDNAEYTYKIVGSGETDPETGKISNECPVSKSILGKKVGDEVQVKGVEEPYKIKILEIKYIVETPKENAKSKGHN